jgi:SAM-dependent methyltransferase
MPKEQRFTFDEVADLYSRTRPGYPAELIEQVLAYAGASGAVVRLLEIGCGGGQATTAFASVLPRQRRLNRISQTSEVPQIVALEPGRNLARCTREKLTRMQRDVALAEVEIVVTTFEDYSLPPQPFDLVISAQAFHWLAPGVRFAKSAAALRPDGTLAVFGNKPHHLDSPLYQEIEACYAECAPSMPKTLPANDASTARDDSIAQAFAKAPQFRDQREHAYRWSQHYTADDYLALMQTQSNHRLLPSAELDALLTRIQRAIERAGGGIEVPYVAHLLLARRATPIRVEAPA